MIISAHGYARAGLVGNPSDSYFGKTLSCIVRNFKTTVHLWESPHFEILPTCGDLARFDSIKGFLRDQRLHGYYGGMRMVKATIKRFHEYCRQKSIALNDQNFTVSFETDIPRMVGLSGSGAIVVAMLRALTQFYNVQIPKQELPALAWAVEQEELGIPCSLQARVIQVYEGIVYMDFDRALMGSRGHGNYETLTPTKMPPLYVAYDPERVEVSDLPNRNLRELFNRGDATVVGAIRRYRELTDRGRDAMMKGDWESLGKVMDENFDLRKTIMPIAPENLRMIEAARAVGASAKFCGSGGSICGLYKDGRQYQQLVDAMATLRCTVTRPIIYES